MESQALKARIPTVSIFSEIEGDLPQVEAYIEATLAARDPLLVEISTYLLRAGGKRLRPALVLLAAKAYSYDLPRLLPVATAVELIHMATLVHDDVVDHSRLRRGRPTVNAKWSDAFSVLAGDYLFAKSFSLLAQTGNNELVRIMSEVVYEMSTGEIEQLASAFDLSQTQADYFERIRQKTGFFIAESCRLGAVAVGAPVHVVEALTRYGSGLGMGFQVIDDILDFTATTAKLGKPIGSDLRAGLLTLPVLHALQVSPRAEALQGIIETREVTDARAEEAVGIIREAGSLEYTFQTAQRFIQEAKAALAELPDTPARANLAAVADFVLEREF
ncbi:MAG: polyprenyl synthetase family protein [Symbiobacteriia bacterium]